MRPRYAVEPTLAEFVDNLALVRHRHTEPHRLQSEALVVAIDIGKARAGGEHHLAIYAARENVQLPPLLFALLRGERLDYYAGLIEFSMKICFDKVAQLNGYFVRRPRCIYAPPFGEVLQLPRLFNLQRSLLLCCGSHS